MEKLNGIELIIFDMDGLMFDTEKISYEAWKKAANMYQYHISLEIFEKTIGTNLNRTRELFIDFYGEKFPFELVREERVKISNELVSVNGVPIKNGLKELLQYLRNNGFRMAVATSTSKNRASNLLKLANVDDYFEYVLCGDEITNSKPDPEIFIKVAEKLNCSPMKCLVLEDSEMGIIAAAQANMIPVMIPDIIEPSEEVRQMVFRIMNSLLEFKQLIKEHLENE